MYQRGALSLIIFTFVNSAFDLYMNDNLILTYDQGWNKRYLSSKRRFNNKKYIIFYNKHKEKNIKLVFSYSKLYSMKM